MLSKCIRRLSFRSIADDRSSRDDNNNSCKGPLYPLHAPTPLKPTPAPADNSTWTSALWSLSPKPATRRPAADTTCTPMYARCTLMTCGAGRYVLSVLMTSSSGCGYEQGEVVAQSAVARNVRPGSLQFRLHSPSLQLDTSMDTELTKSEHNWTSGDIEKQFILNSKTGQSVQGLLGKVVIEQNMPRGNSSPLFELTLVSKQQPQPQEDLAWGAAGFRELASLLNLVDECDDFTLLAKDLGFTEHEINTRLLPASEPFAALLSTYQSRGGTPAELVRAMYSTSRVRGLGVTGGSPTPLARAVSQCSTVSAGAGTCTTPGAHLLHLEEELEELQEAALLRVTSSSGGRKRKASQSTEASTKRMKVEEEEEEEEVDDLCDAATLPVGDLEQGVNQDHLPPTPPATPLKRLTGSSTGHQEARNVFSYPQIA